MFYNLAGEPAAIATATDPVLCDWCGRPVSTACMAADHDRLNRGREQHWREQVAR